MITAQDFINKGLIVGNPSAANIAEFNTALAYLQQSATATQLIQAESMGSVSIDFSKMATIKHLCALQAFFYLKQA